MFSVSALVCAIGASAAGVLTTQGDKVMRNALGLSSVLVVAMLAESVFGGESFPANLYQGASSAEVARAGWPWCRWKWARAQNPCEYIGYYVGGGAPGPRSREHCPDEGTWGWDYQGKKLQRVVRLGWTYPPRRQGGTGSYDPDGPRVAEAVKEALHAQHSAE